MEITLQPVTVIDRVPRIVLALATVPVTLIVAGAGSGLLVTVPSLDVVSNVGCFQR